MSYERVTAAAKYAGRFPPDDMAREDIRIAFLAGAEWRSSASETALREARAAATAREEALRKVANDERDSHRALLPVLAAADYLIGCYRNLGKHPVRGLPEAEAAYDSARAALRDETGGDAR